MSRWWRLPAAEGARHVAASREADERAAARRSLLDLAHADDPYQWPAGT